MRKLLVAAVGFTAGVLLVVGCSGAAQRIGATPPFAKAATEASAESGEAAPRDAGTAPPFSARLVSAPPKDASAPRKPFTREELARFERALAEGRTATQRQDYESAIRSFDAAILVIPDHPRALAERGYAELLANRLDAAALDLQRAQAVERDAKLDAQIWFNIGLLRERRGERDEAKGAFERSYLLSPTKAAASKIGAMSTCTAQITLREPPPKEADLWAPTVMRVASWTELYGVFAETFGKPKDEIFATDDLARKALCESDCQPAADGAVVFSPYFFQNSFRQQVSQEKGSLFVVHLGLTSHTIFGTPCGSIASFERNVVRHGDVVEIVGHDEATDDACEDRRRAQDPADASCGECPITDQFETRAYFDVATATHLVTIRQRYAPGAPPPVSSKLDGKELVLSGGKCDRRIDLVALARRPVSLPKK